MGPVVGYSEHSNVVSDSVKGVNNFANISEALKLRTSHRSLFRGLKSE
jgi:hypothetical protein